jgi:hypothetical protein
MSNSLLYRMNVGVPGTINRVEDAIVESAIFDGTNAPVVFGVPVKLTSNKVCAITTGDDQNDVVGFLARSFPAQAAATNDAPNITELASVMKQGYMIVKCNAGTAAANGVVYVRVTDHGAGEYPLGGVEAAADSAKCVAVTNCTFTGAADASGNVEIRYNI